MRFSTGVATALCAAALVTLSVPASAQQPPPGTPTAADKEKARGFMDEGDKKRDSGDLKAALAAYEKADQLMNVPSTAIEVARTQIALNLFLEAQATLARIVKMPAKPNEPAPFAAARKTAEQLGNDVQPRIPSIAVTVTNADPAMPPAITIDGETVTAEQAATPKKVNPGPHTVTVKAGTIEKKSDFNLPEKEAKVVTFDVKPPVVAPPPPPPPKETSGAKIMMYAGFGVGVVGLGIGSVTGLMSISKTSDLKDHCPQDKCKPGSQGDIDSAKTLGTVSTIGFVVGLAGVGVGVVGLVLSGKESKTETAPAPAAAFRPVDVRAVLGPSYAGIAGAF